MSVVKTTPKKEEKGVSPLATMKGMIGQMLDKIADQAAQIARQETARNRFEKQAHAWEERALKAEQKLADSVDWQVSSQNNFEAHKAEQCKAEMAGTLLERGEYYHEGLFSHTPETVPLIMEISEFLRPGSVPEWAKPREEVASNKAVSALAPGAVPANGRAS